MRRCHSFDAVMWLRTLICKGIEKQIIHHHHLVPGLRDHETYEVLLHSGALQGTLDLLERAALNPTGEAREGAAGSGGRAAQELERRAALQILANLIRHDVSLRALFEDHPALDGVLLPAASSAGVWRVHERVVAA